MTLTLTDEQRMFAQSAQGFMASSAPVSHLRKLRDANDPDGVSKALWHEFGEMGFAAIMVPEEHGGLGLGLAEAGLVLREMGKNLTPSPFLSSAVGAVAALSHASAQHKEEWLPRLAAGQAIFALALDEGVKHHPEGVALSAVTQNSAFALSGEKNNVAMAHIADAIVVLAKPPEGGQALYLVDPSHSGVAIETSRLVDASLVSTLTFSACPAQFIGGAEVAAEMLSALRIGAAAEMVGLAQGAMALTMEYLQTREQFGTQIGSFQALQHRASHLYAEIEVAQAAVRKAEIMQDADKVTGKTTGMPLASVAKASAGMTSLLAVQEGVQMHGGIGMTDEHDIGLYMKRQRVLEEFAGDANFHAELLARHHGY